MDLPNLFTYATSELSQDAFICYLIKHAMEPIDEELYRTGRELIVIMYNLSHNSGRITIQDIDEINKLEKQFHKIDVYFEAKILDKKYGFIIEDKTYSKEHSNQLMRYKESLASEEYPPEEILGIYFKTGYVFEDEIKKCIEAEYVILNAEGLYKPLKDCQSQDQILNQYRKFLFEEYVKPQSQYALSISSNNYKAFDQLPVKYEYIKELKEKCPEHINETHVECSNNRSGTSWCQFYFATFEKTYDGDIPEYLFYRIDEKKRGFYLRINLYSTVKNACETVRAEKLRRVKLFRKLFRSLQGTDLQFADPAKKAIIECEVAILYFDNDVNTIQRTLKYMPKIHKAFVEGAKQLTDH